MKKTKRTFTQTCSTVGNWKKPLKVLEGRWKILILFHLFSAPVLRFSELRRAVSGISQKMLIQQLRDLEKMAWFIARYIRKCHPRWNTC